MKKLLRHICAMLLAMLATGCTDTLISADEPLDCKAGDVVLTVTADGGTTRSHLQGTMSRHNVQEVYVVLYSGSGAGATYITHQNLYWNPSSEPGNGTVQRRQFKLIMPIERGPGTYSVLCVGIDDTAEEVYGLTPPFGGGTLGEAMADLRGANSMKNTEFFVGHSSFYYDPANIGSASVDMHRRVAGICLYFKEIPNVIHGRDVAALRLMMGPRPATTLSLMNKDEVGTGQQSDNARIIDRIDFADITPEAALPDDPEDDESGFTPPGSEDDLYFTIKEEYTSSLGIKPNTVMLSSYLTPTAAGGDNTFTLEVLDAGDNAIIRIPLLLDEELNYAVLPNHLYHIGDKDTEADEPSPFKPDVIRIIATPWGGREVNTGFEEVPKNAYFKYPKDRDEYIYDCINCRDYFYIEPSLLQKHWKLTIINDKKDNISYNWLYFRRADGTYVNQLSSEDFADGNVSEVRLEIVMNDHVTRRDYEAEGIDWQTDWRTAKIMLQMEDDFFPCDSLEIKQYNAITVRGWYYFHSAVSHRKDENAVDCGFSRFDMGAERDEKGKLIEGTGTTIGWGFGAVSFLNIFTGTEEKHISVDQANIRAAWDGQMAYNDLINGPDDYTKWITGSAAGEAKFDALELRDETEKITNTASGVFWYLPSQWELYHFYLQHAYDNPGIVNIIPGQNYWSSTPFRSVENSQKTVKTYAQNSTLKLTEPQKLIDHEDESRVYYNLERDPDGSIWITWPSKPTATCTKARVRRARHFEGYTSPYK